MGTSWRTRPCAKAGSASSHLTDRSDLFVILRVQLSCHGRESTEQTVRIAVDSRGKEQRRTARRSCRGTRFVRATVVELETPQAVDRNGRVARIQQIPQELAAHDIKRGDGSAEPISDQQIVAEESEVLRRERHSPRSLEPRAILETLQQLSSCSEDVDETALFAEIVVGAILGGVLL